MCGDGGQDREQVLAAIDALLQQQPLTSQHLADFITQHPDVQAPVSGDQQHAPPSPAAAADSASSRRHPPHKSVSLAAPLYCRPMLICTLNQVILLNCL